MRNFILAMKNPDRSWTKQQWKVVSRWLRLTTGIIDKEIDWSKVDKAFVDMMVTGTGIYVP